MNEVLRGAQVLMRHLTGSPLKADGIPGPTTSKMFYGLPSAHRLLVRDVLGEHYPGVVPVYVTRKEVYDAASVIASETGVPLDAILTIVETENGPGAEGWYLDRDGKYQGLGQFDRATWKAVSDSPDSQRVEVIPSLRAIAKLYLSNRSVFIRQFPFGEFTPEIAYLYHNQGAGSAKSYLTTGVLRYPHQSDHALRLFKVARSEYGTQNGHRAIS